jgi:hypothetical protein
MGVASRASTGILLRMQELYHPDDARDKWSVLAGHPAMPVAPGARAPRRALSVPLCSVVATASPSFVPTPCDRPHVVPSLTDRAMSRHRKVSPSAWGTPVADSAPLAPCGRGASAVGRRQGPAWQGSVHYRKHDKRRTVRVGCIGLLACTDGSSAMSSTSVPFLPRLATDMQHVDGRVRQLLIAHG